MAGVETLTKEMTGVKILGAKNEERLNGHDKRIDDHSAELADLFKLDKNCPGKQIETHVKHLINAIDSLRRSHYVVIAGFIIIALLQAAAYVYK